jgi:hypothetical protein
MLDTVRVRFIAAFAPFKNAGGVPLDAACVSMDTGVRMRVARDLAGFVVNF